MTDKAVGPIVNTRVIDIAQKRFGSSKDARDALRKAVDAITDEQLHHARGIHVLIMA
jgi:hypothetical protein